jgi:hypothetical protein
LIKSFFSIKRKMWHWFFSACFIIGVILVIVGLIGAFVGCNNKKEIEGHYHDNDLECTKYGCTKNKVPGWAWVLLIIGIVMIVMGMIFLIVSWVNPSSKVEENVKITVKDHTHNHCPRPCCNQPVQQPIQQNCCLPPVVHQTPIIVDHVQSTQTLHHHHVSDRPTLPAGLASA